MASDAAADPLLGQLGVCTDEVSPDLGEALAFARSEGLKLVELLAFDGHPVVEMGEERWHVARARLERAGLSCSAIGSLCCKATPLGGVAVAEVTRHPAFLAEMDVLRASIRAAAVFGAPLVRIFGFRRDGMVGLGNPGPRPARGGEIPGPTLEKIAAALRFAADLAADAGLLLGLENVRSCWANTGFNTARIIAATDHPALRAIWDPANDYVSGGEPHPEGYATLRGRICHIHVKGAALRDAASGLTAWTAVGGGDLDYAAQFAALRRDGYAGTLSLETHWRLPDGGEPHGVRASAISLAGIRRALAASAATRA